MAETYGLAADPDLQDVTGGYCGAPNVPVKANKYAYNRETQNWLWQVFWPLPVLRACPDWSDWRPD
jgi:hypothetical protein